jgi:hypothetical protein
MRVLTWLLFATLAAGQTPGASPAPSAPASQTPPPSAPAGQPPSSSPAAGPEAKPAAPRIVGTMSELMIDLIYPTSDAILYVETRAPKNDIEWNELRAKTLMLTEAANLLMMPGRARDQDRWMADAKLMLDAGAAAFRAAKNKDLNALIALNDQVYVSCTTCHMHYRTSYGRGRATAPPPAR